MNRRTKRRLAVVCCWVACASINSAYSASISHDPSEEPRYRLKSDETIDRTIVRRIQTTLAHVESTTEMADARGRHHDDPMERNIFVHESTASPVSTPSDNNTDIPTLSPTIGSGTSGGTPQPSVSVPTASPSVGLTNITMSPSFDQENTLEPTLLSNMTEIPTGIESNETQSPTLGEMGNETIVPTIVSNETLAPSDTNVTVEPLSPLGEFLSLALTDDGSLSTPGTPQFEALLALETSNPDLDPAVEADRIEIIQRYTLNTIYFSTSGANWVNNDLWTSESHPCGDGTASSWFGVECDTELVLVEQLSLPTNDMLGSLPSEIRGLNGLQLLNIFENQLTGPIPNDIGGLTLLTALEAGSNFFESTIPPSIGNLTSLDVLNLYSNLLSGGIPVEIGQLQALRSFSVDTNFLNGPLPQELFSLTSIVTLDLDNNQLSGSLPSDIGALTNAVSLFFSTNLLEGTIPSELGNLQDLVNFAANVNFISGTLPDIFGGMVMLKSFELALNFLTGSLPPTLMESDILEVLELSGNQLTGLLSEDIGGMIALKELRLDRNLFSGQLPMNLTQLESLEVISMSQNFLTGIPVELSALPALRELQVGANFLLALPEALVNDFPSLEFLNVSKNSINAADFPTRFGSPVLTTFDVSFNPLDGAFNISSLYGLTGLQNILMAGCSIVATLPDDISQLQNLVTLDFNNNLFLSGTIPASLGDIPSLQNILLGSNLLEGSIPADLARLANLTNLELQNNFLTGAIPPEIEALPNLVNFNCEGNTIEGCGAAPINGTA
ncbi:RHS repeat-associated core domain containing protein [Nitzschia inconspicua]|uniref:RHS repeat-associated core domain containing protein n=1 Tax=Nitzschia inconspicua TaxID=303405 RepID=A0A9K3LSB7_9STRA|nr:RHS repeat-associated core domain containing protein [Nitzschia inconspicua]